MSAAALAIGIDVGSTNVKVVALAADGSLAAHRRRPLATNDRPPICEQDPEEIWDAVLSGVAECVAEATIDAPVVGVAPLVTIGVTSQYSSTVPVGPGGTPAGPLVMWRDRRGTEACHELLGTPGLFELWVERHGIPPIGGGLGLAHLLHLSAEDPGGQTRFVEVMDGITARLTGRVTATRHSMFTSQLCDNRSPQDVSRAYDPDLLAASGIDPARLPPLVAPDEPVGTVTADLAARLGVDPASNVAPGINDTGAVALATGAEKPRQGGVIAGASIGTTSVLVTRMDHKAEDLDHEILTMPAPDIGYLVMAENGLGGRVPEAMLALLDGADEMGETRFAGAEAALASTEPGAGGVLGLPWLDGSMAPSGSSTARGGFIGVSLSTTRAQLIRATFEGVAHNLAWLLRHVEAFIGAPVDEIRLTGGGAQVAGWPQIIADVLNRPVRVVAEPGLAAARSAALRARHLGSGSDEWSPTPAATSASLQPNLEARGVHERQQQAFERAFDALIPVLELLNP